MWVQHYFGQTPRYRNLHQTQNGYSFSGQDVRKCVTDFGTLPCSWPTCNVARTQTGAGSYGMNLSSKTVSFDIA
ncbi:uncharacterized protein LOC144163623 isoform X2 [Haemaphysalis longicornis]